MALHGKQLNTLDLCHLDVSSLLISPHGDAFLLRQGFRQTDQSYLIVLRYIVVEKQPLLLRMSAVRSFHFLYKGFALYNMCYSILRSKYAIGQQSNIASGESCSSLQLLKQFTQNERKEERPWP